MIKKRHSFRTKLLVSFLLCSLIPLLLCSVMLVHITKLRLNSQAHTDIAQQITTISQSLDTVSSGLRSAGQLLSQDQIILTAMKGRPMQNTLVNAHLFASTEDIRGFASVFLYNLDGKLLCSTENSGAQASLPVNWGILQATKNDSGAPVFQVSAHRAGSSTPLLQGAVRVAAPNGAPMGYLVLEMSQKNFSRLLDGKRDAQDNLLIVNRFWHPVYASNTELLTGTAPLFRSQLLHGKVPGSQSENFLYEIVQHKPTGLYLILQKPQTFNTNTTKMLFVVSVSCALLCVVISVMIYIPLSKQISAPVQQLQKAFGKLGHDDLNVQLPTGRKDELGQLAESFNLMVKDVKQNREALLENHKELNQAQIRLLQTQLNPHFLCNTLDTMKWISKINNVPEVAEMSTNLADILRYCITSDQFVPLYKEIDFLEKYIKIQKIRMGDKFDFRVDLPEELGLCIVPKMILQPLVENSIIHGLSEDSESTIHVKIRTVGDMLKITVTDNGRGLPEALAGKPYVRPAAPEGKHLGLYNVNTILSKNYGPGCGLFLDKGPNGIGTSVIATLPISMEETDHDKSIDC